LSSTDTPVAPLDLDRELRKVKKEFSEGPGLELRRRAFALTRLQDRKLKARRAARRVKRRSAK
jgi:hypothetical protein